MGQQDKGSVSHTRVGRKGVLNKGLTPKEDARLEQLMRAPYALPKAERKRRDALLKKDCAAREAAP